MQKRRFGRSDHQTSLAILGGYAFKDASAAEVEGALEMAMEAGVNQIDVAPSYGKAEELLGPWLRRYRERFFLCCKTLARKRALVEAELDSSLKRLQVQHIDLYQLHAVTSLEELDEVTRRGGALEAIQAARHAGLVRFIGITGHGFYAPQVFLEALRRFEFDAVLFPLSYVLYANPIYRQSVGDLLQECRQRDVGSMVIKAIARSPWGLQTPVYRVGYQPFCEPDEIQQAVNFALSQDITGLCTAGDLYLQPLIIQACQNFRQLSSEEQEELIASAVNIQSIYTP